MSTPSTVTRTRQSARTAAPLINMGVAWAARRTMVKGYESRTGKPAPMVLSHEATFVSKVLWAATMASVLVVIEVVIWKLIGEDD